MTSKVSRYRAIPLDEFFKGSQPLPSCWWWWAAMRPLWHTAIRICRTGADVQNCAKLCKIVQMVLSEFSSYSQVQWIMMVIFFFIMI